MDLTVFNTILPGPGATVSPDEVEALVREQYGIEGRAERLTGERDENFRLHVPNGAGYVLKVAHAFESPTVTHLPVATLLHLEQTAPELPCPRVIRALDGRTLVPFIDARGATRTATVCTFLPGKLLFAATRSSTQRHACGHLLASLARALRGFEHPATRRAVAWDLAQLPRLASLIPLVEALPEATFLASFVARFATEIAPRLAGVRHQFVHNDCNARNIIVDPADESNITGIIDFGDAVHTALIADVAVGVMGQLCDPDNAQECIRDFVGAYNEVEPLLTEELALLNALIAGRVVQNVVITSWHRSQRPTGGHFDGFDAAFFEWRLELAKFLSKRALAGSAYG